MKCLITYFQLIMLICFMSYSYGGIINVPDDQPTIQAGIDAAVAGDTVMVAAGTYTEAVDLKSGVIVRGAGADKTIIQGTGVPGPVVKAYYVDTYTKIDGFTITGGWGDGGKGIDCYHASPTISNNVISGNGGSGISCYDSTSTIRNNEIISNNGGGIECRGILDGEVLIMGNRIIGNVAYTGGGITCFYARARITNNVIANNESVVGGGVYSLYAAAHITNTLILDNRGGGVYCWGSGGSIVNSIVWDNGDDLDGCWATYSCIEDGDAGEGNISLNPIFVDAANGNYQLQALSPCIDTGKNVFPPVATDLLGNSRYIDGNGDGKVIIDMGPYEYIPGIIVVIDIKPGSAVNPINLRSKGVIPVALLTTDNFDAWAVDVSTITFGPNSARPVHISSEDVDGDGDLDIVFHFRQQETGIRPDDVTATLKGITTYLMPFVGTDAVIVVSVGGSQRPVKRR